MEFRTLELNLVSAKDLQDVNLFSKMDVYAVVTLSGDPHQNQKAKTTVDRDGGKNPTWNFPMKFNINESLAHRLTLEIKLRSERSIAGDRDIGQVFIPVKELIDQPGDGRSLQYVSYQVRKPSGKPKGALNISYKFGDKVTAPAVAPPPRASAPVMVSKDEPVMAYPPAAAGSSSVPYAAGYPPATGKYPPPPPQYGAGYGYPPPAYGYAGYPQAQPGYGYPPQPGYGYPAVQNPPKKNKFGMGLGAGLLGGALGGLLIGDMVSDVGAYDSGYDAGFDDAGGFDF